MLHPENAARHLAVETTATLLNRRGVDICSRRGDRVSLCERIECRRCFVLCPARRRYVGCSVACCADCYLALAFALWLRSTSRIVAYDAAESGASTRLRKLCLDCYRAIDLEAVLRSLFPTALRSGSDRHCDAVFIAANPVFIRRPHLETKQL